MSAHVCVSHLAHGEQTPSSLLRAPACLGGWIWGTEQQIFGPTEVVENGSYLRCAFKAVFALVVLSKGLAEALLSVLGVGLNSVR